ncbi:MAG: hypothetical protein ACRD2W_21860 [Acidimicrobiales bacterium]
MSDDWIRIVPSEPSFVPSGVSARALIALVSRMMPSAEEVTVETSDEVAFVDAGANQGPALCPRCGSELDHEPWAAAMTESYEASAFKDRRVVLPCCSAACDLNDLDYGDWPVAFARWWVDCMNPNLGRLADEQVRGLAAALGHTVTIVYQHI